MAVTTNDLTAREGKVLRYVVSHDYEPVVQSMCLCQIEWSDLPKTLLQAKRTLENLRRHGLVKRVGAGYAATKQGISLIRYANKNGIWRTTD